MNQETLQADYLVVGAGAMAMAFVDVIAHEDPKATVVMVDRRARAGGHWNDAYPFVGLHQPAAFYGVSSEVLGQGGSDLSSKPEILAYYETVLKKLEATGRVRFIGRAEYRGNGQIVSMLDANRSWQVEIARKVVDAGYMNVQVPATTPPRYEVAPEVRLVPINGLATLDGAVERYVVVGAGKTGMDAVLFLLDSGVAPEIMYWIMPNDAWLFDRAAIQPGKVASDFRRQMVGIADAANVDEVFVSLEKAGTMCRVDPSILPSKWRCATVSQPELAKLRSIDNVVRMGRIERIDADRVVLRDGELPTGAGTLYVDCTADGLAAREPRPIFDGARLTLQSVFMCQQVFSAAIIGHLETLAMSDAERNEMFHVVPHPEWKNDYLTALRTSIENVIRAQPTIGRWLQGCRLNFAHHESLLRLFVRGFQMQRVFPRASESIDRMLSAPG